jgi:hypothetical protein
MEEEGGEDHPLIKAAGSASEAGKKAEGRARRPGLAYAFSRARRIAWGPSAAIPPVSCVCARER